MNAIDEKALLQDFQAYQAAGGVQGKWSVAPLDGAVGSAPTSRSSQAAAMVAPQPASRFRVGAAEVVFGFALCAVVAWLLWDLWPAESAQGSSNAAVRSAPVGFPALALRPSSEEPTTPEHIASLFAARQARQLPPSTGSEQRLAEAAPQGQPRALPDDAVAPAPLPSQQTVATTGQPAPKRPGRLVRAAGRAPAPPIAVGEPASPDEPPLGWFFGGDTVAPVSKPAPPAVRKLPLAVGTEFKVSLQVGVSSASSSNKVLARLVKPMRRGKKVLAPKGAVLLGYQSGMTRERIQVTFTKLAVEGEKPYELKAVAIARDKSPGLLAQVDRASLSERQNSRVHQGALELGKELAVTALGPAGEAARALTEGAVDEAKREQEFDRSVVLRVPAGTRFDVVVVE